MIAGIPAGPGGKPNAASGRGVVPSSIGATRRLSRYAEELLDDRADRFGVDVVALTLKDHRPARPGGLHQNVGGLDHGVVAAPTIARTGVGMAPASSRGNRPSPRIVAS